MNCMVTRETIGYTMKTKYRKTLQLYIKIPIIKYIVATFSANIPPLLEASVATFSANIPPLLEASVATFSANIPPLLEVSVATISTNTG